MSAASWGARLAVFVYENREDYNTTCPSCDGDGVGHAILTSMGRVGQTWDGKCSRCKGSGTVTKRRWKKD